MRGGRVVVHGKLPGWVLCSVLAVKIWMNKVLKYHVFIPGCF
jgi:cytidylate kinase